MVQSSQLHFQEQHINDGLEDEILFSGLDGDDECNMNGIDELFGTTDWDSECDDKLGYLYRIRIGY